MAEMEFELINETNFEKARRAVDLTIKDKKLPVVVARDDNFNRKVLEKTELKYLLFVNFKDRKDKLKQRDSGLNEVMCKIASKRGIIIGFDFSEILKLQGKELAWYLARVRQNIILCKKFKVPVVLFNIYGLNKKDLFSFLISLGMSTNMAKYAVEEALN